MATQTQYLRSFGRLKAQELSPKDVKAVSGGNPDEVIFDPQGGTSTCPLFFPVGGVTPDNTIFADFDF